MFVFSRKTLRSPAAIYVAILAVGVLAFLMVRIAVAPASPLNGCKYSAKNLVIWSTSIYTTATDNAGGNWSAGTNLNLTFGSAGYSVRVVSNDYGATGWAGQTDHTTCSGGFWTGRQLNKHNTHYLATANAGRRQMVAAHEMGHAWGQAHFSPEAGGVCNGAVRGIMRTDAWSACNWSLIQADDVITINGLYP